MLLKSESTPKIKAIGSNRGDPFAIVPRAPAPAEDSDEAAEAAPIQRLVGELTAPATWEMILAYAADQAGEAAANRGPRRTVAVHERYQRYTEWCATRGHTGVELVIATAVWLSVKPTLKKPEVRAALEPNIVPYHVESHIEHWVLWYHPEATPGATELDAGLFVAHLRLVLPSLREEDEVIAFQNLPQFRSVPQMAHAHVFLRPRSDATAKALASLRFERRIRSPWAEAERLGGRASEVGF